MCRPSRTAFTRCAHIAAAVTILFAAVSTAVAGEISFSGVISQSTADGTGPAVNNPLLNNIADGDDYTITLDFPSAISEPDAFDPLDGAVLAFTDSVAAAAENSFASVYLTVSLDSNPALYDVSLLGCLSTGSGCAVGNSLSTNFSVAAANFTSVGAPAGLIPGLFPSLDLLEDDGATDIQASVTSFSNSSPSGATPEPSSASLLASIAALLTLHSIRTKGGKKP